MTSSVESPDGAPSMGKRPRVGRQRLLFALLGLAVVVGTFALVLPKIADYRDVWAVVATLTWQWMVVLGIATVLNLSTFAPRGWWRFRVCVFVRRSR